MKNERKTELLVNVAKLYYEHNYSQNMIAKKLNLSRPYISKLLNDAREQSIVTIHISDPTQTESPLEREIRQRFQLRRAIAVPLSLDETPISAVGRMGARYISSIVGNGDILGVSWGKTIFATSQHLSPREDLEGVTVMQLCGGVSNLKRNTYSAEIVKNFADAFGGVPYMLPLPAVVDDAEVKDTILRDHNIRHVMEYGRRANIVMFTMGAFGEHNALLKAGYLSPHEMDHLSRAGAVGDICTHIIDADGNICDAGLESRTIAVPLDDLRRADFRIGIATGDHKVDCICGALRGGYVNVLISDEPTVRLVLEKLGR